MTGYRDASNVLRSIAAFRYRDASNVLQTAKAIRYRDASNTLRTLYGLSDLKATATPDTSEGFGYSAGTVAVTTNAVTISVTGGSGSYTYSYAFPGGLGWSAVSPTSATTQFRSPGLGPGDNSFETAICTVTDTSNSATTTVNILLSAYNSF